MAVVRFSHPSCQIFWIFWIFVILPMFLDRYLGAASDFWCFLISPMYFNENWHHAHTDLYIAPGADPAVQTQKPTE